MWYFADMTKPRVYVETTIPSFYYEERIASAIMARRDWTQMWWESGADDYDLVTSAAVLDELGRGHAGARRETTGVGS